MIVRHRGQQPIVDADAVVAATAVVSGDVRIGPGVRILHGAVVTAEDAPVEIGADTVVMEHAVIRGRGTTPALIGAAVMIGPHAHVNGSVIDDGSFIATGAALFPGSVIGAGSEVRIHGVVQVNTVLPPGSTVPIGWVAVGDPARILPPDRHDEIWAVQSTLDFPGTVYGVDRSTPMRELMRRQSDYYRTYRDDEVV